MFVFCMFMTYTPIHATQLFRFLVLISSAPVPVNVKELSTHNGVAPHPLLLVTCRLKVTSAVT